MSDRSNLIYTYDGSFDGLMCCVFESYDKDEIPSDIVSVNSPEITFLPVKEIETDLHKSKRVLASIPGKIGTSAFDFIRNAFLTCIPQKELHILLFLRLGYKHGQSVMTMLANDTVDILSKAVRHLKNESHLLTGFIRFSVMSGVLVSEIEPKNFVLPLLTQHFCERYPEERFMIYDVTHGAALIYQPYKAKIIPIEDFQMPDPDEDEQFFRELWKLFYNTIEVQGRHNEKCRMSHMPKRYWKYMTEFSKKPVLKLNGTKSYNLY